VAKKPAPSAAKETDLAHAAAAMLRATAEEPLPPAIADLTRKLQFALDKRAQSGGK
jgi:hypothetical protein